MPSRLFSIDFRSPSVPVRFGSLNEIPGWVHERLEPPAGDGADLAAYVRAMCAGPDRTGDTAAVVVFCASYSLAGPVIAELGRGGLEIVSLIAVDPQLATPEQVRLSCLDVLDQMPNSGIPRDASAVLSWPAAQVADRLGEASGILAASVRPALLAGLGFTEDDADEDLIADMTRHYRRWFRHILACYAATPHPPTLPVHVLASRDYDPAGAGRAGAASAGAGPDEAGPDEAGPDEAGPDEAGPDEAGPDEAGVRWRSEGDAMTDSRMPAVLARILAGASPQPGERPTGTPNG